MKSNKLPFADWKVGFVRVTCDNSYTTNGYTLALNNYFPYSVDAVYSTQYNTYTAWYDKANTKLKVFDGGTEVTNGGDLTDVEFTLMVCSIGGLKD